MTVFAKRAHLASTRIRQVVIHVPHVQSIPTRPRRVKQIQTACATRVPQGPVVVLALAALLEPTRPNLAASRAWAALLALSQVSLVQRLILAKPAHRTPTHLRRANEKPIVFAAAVRRAQTAAHVLRVNKENTRLMQAQELARTVAQARILSSWQQRRRKPVRIAQHIRTLRLEVLDAIVSPVILDLTALAERVKLANTSSQLDLRPATTARLASTRRLRHPWTVLTVKPTQTLHLVALDAIVTLAFQDLARARRALQEGTSRRRDRRNASTAIWASFRLPLLSSASIVAPMLTRLKEAPVASAMQASAALRTRAQRVP
jgi:hypothetical protein